MTSAKLSFCTLALAVAVCSAQAPPPAPAQPDPAPNEPAITQIRKSVAFIKLICKDGGKEYDVRGTGFFIEYPDSRLGASQRFAYLVTNRHVALCWNDAGRPMQVESISLRMNRKEAEGGNFAFDSSLNDHGNAPWVLPEDDSIDLAVLPVAPDVARFDFKTVPFTWLATSDLLSKHRITEGEPVFFAGFFYQFPGTRRIEPIIRHGTIAMMPYENIPFVGHAEKVYLADVHVFGGNSGSPAFINLGGMHEGMMDLSQDFRLLGVVNGDVSEDENFNLELTATIRGTARANSGISTIVPADDLKALLEDPRLQKIRDNLVTARGAQK